MSITSPPTRYWASSVHNSATSINKNSSIGNLNKDASLASSCSRLAVSLLESVVITTTIEHEISYWGESQYPITGPEDTVGGHIDTEIMTVFNEQYSSTVVETFVTSQSYFRNAAPPKDCCDSCEINVNGARIFFWPPKDDNTTLPSNTSAIGNKILVSDGFTL